MSECDGEPLKTASLKAKSCNCGRSKQSKVVPCTLASLCKCAEQKVSCAVNPECRCEGCRNNYGIRDRKKNLLSTVCRCGVNGSKGDSCLSQRCQCHCSGNGCGPMCGCKSCQNAFGVRPESISAVKYEPDKKTKRKLCFKNQGKFESLSSKAFLSSINETAHSPRWTASEEVTLSQVEAAVSSKKNAGKKKSTQIALLYNSTIQCSPNLGKSKSKLQAARKLSHMNKNKN